MTEKERPLGNPTTRHGTIGGYTNDGCRCDPCSEANRTQHNEYMDGNAHQRRLANLRSRIQYWRKEAELRSFRKQFHGPKSAAKARAEVERYQEMYEAERVGNGDLIGGEHE